jgi:phosphatidylserine decarboxylase
MEHRVMDRKRGALVDVPVLAGRWMRILYNTAPGRAALWALIKRKWVSALYARYARTARSKRAADRVVAQYGIDMSEFAPYRTYEEFFTRGRETIDMPRGASLGAMAQGYLSAYEDIDIDALFCVKGEGMRLRDILDDEALAGRYRGGTLLRFRLAPHHYHHLHHFDDAEIVAMRDIKGGYYSVNPLSLSAIVRLYARNRRRIVVMQTKRFGQAVLVEVGATMIGSIVNTFSQGDAVRIGEDGGHFAPGGSMLLLLFERGRVSVNEDLLGYTRDGYETMVSLAEIIAERNEAW